MDISQMDVIQNKMRFNLIVNSPFPFRLNRMTPVSIGRDEIGDMTKPQLSNFRSEFLINGQWV